MKFRLAAATFVIAFGIGLLVWKRLSNDSAELSSWPNTTAPNSRFEKPRRRAISRKPQETIETYVGRINQGLTPGEILSLTAEFQNLEFGESLKAKPGMHYEKQRKRMTRWYLETLQRGLGLDSQQTEEAKLALRELVDRDIEAFQTNVAESSAIVSHEGKQFRIVSSRVIYKLTDPNYWMKDEAFAPWSLCELTEEQRAITWLPLLENQNDRDSPILRKAAENWLALTGHYRNYEPTAKSEIVQFSSRNKPSLLENIGAAFPLIESQSYPESKIGSDPGKWQKVQRQHARKQIQSLHPAQLRMMLLFEPEKAPWIEQIFRQERSE